jgi:hypothetical protein
VQAFSTLEYIPADLTDFAGSPESDPFQNVGYLGTIVYTNGTSQLDSLIFGATLTISFTDPSVTPIVVPFTILTTTNTGIDPDYDADLIVFPGLGPGGSDISFHVYEGETAYADVYGSIVGDPVATFSNFIVSGGFLGTGPLPSPVPVPEPATAALAGGVIAVAAAVRLARR